MIEIKVSDLKIIIAHCLKEEPIEACGILAGQIRKQNGTIEKIVQKVYRCRNELNSSTEYRIAAEEQFKAFTNIEELALDLLGFYHSHPYTDPRPSSMDIARGNYYSYSYVIVSLHPSKVSSWILVNEDEFNEEEIHIHDS